MSAFTDWAVSVPGWLFRGWPAGLPLWLRDAAWWVILALAGYLLARIVGPLVVALIRLVGPAFGLVLRGLVIVARGVLLLPDLAVASLYRGFRARPPALVYRYGDSVMRLAEWADEGAEGLTDWLEWLIRRCRVIGRALVVAVVVVWWNAASCGAAPAGAVCAPAMVGWF